MSFKVKHEFRPAAYDICPNNRCVRFKRFSIKPAVHVENVFPLYSPINGGVKSSLDLTIILDVQCAYQI